MEALVILFAGQPDATFLRKLFYIDGIHKLRIGSREYSELFASFESFSKGNVIFHDAIFPIDERSALCAAAELIAARKISTNTIDHVLLLDISFYPLDAEWLDHTFLKACDTDIPLLLYAGTGRGKRLAGLCVQAKDVDAQVLSEERANSAASSDKMADLLDPATVLRLFSSNFSLRHFNSLKISNNVYFFKWSKQIEKMRAEFMFFKNTPSQVRPYFPHVGEFIEKDGGAGYEIEMITQVDVSKALLNGVFAYDANCRKFLESIEQYLNACPRRIVSRQEYQDAAKFVFVEKTQQRVNKLLQLDSKSAMDHTCRLNGWKSLEAFSEYAINCLKRAVASDNTNVLHFSHGDLFFANMLFDPLGGTLKLIDPRGSNGKDTTSCELPVWYDLAKLSHSFLGHYDLMVHGLMDVVMQDDLRLTLKSADILGINKLGDCFRAMLHRMKISVKTVRLYEGALFLSMIPLHEDSPLRMQKQLIRAMQLFQNEDIL